MIVAWEITAFPELRLTRPLSPRPATQLSARKVERLVAEGEAKERHYAMLEQLDMAA